MYEYTVVQNMVEDSIPESSVAGNSGCTGECFECGKDIPIAIWDDEALSGRLVIICHECSDDVPEFNLWNASKMDEHPIPENEEWVVLDKHRNWEENVKERFNVNSKEELEEEFNFANGAEHLFEKPDEVHLEIFIRNPDDKESLNLARKEARRILD